MEHIGVQRLYEIVADQTALEESDFRHFELCPECLEVFSALSYCNRVNKGRNYSITDCNAASSTSRIIPD